MADNKFENTTATVFNIQKFCTDDGPGIRTTVFLKGCHLRCAWCHNPEGLSPAPLLELRRVDCVSCGRCAGVCPNGVHSFSNSQHHIDRSLCVGCGKCVESCPYGALAFCGRTMTAGEVLESALADKPFYFPQGGHHHFRRRTPAAAGLRSGFGYPGQSRGHPCLRGDQRRRGLFRV